MAYAKEDPLELGLVDIELGPESERLDVLEYLDLLVVNHYGFEEVWIAFRNATNDSEGDMVTSVTLEK